MPRLPCLPCLPLLPLLAANLLAGCSDTPSGPDSGPDAYNPCGAGEVYFTGEYVDWDSTEEDFLGVAFATVAEVADPTNTSETAPNGRGSLCLPDSGAPVVTFTQSLEPYLPARFTVHPAAAAAGPYSAHGLTPTRADALFGQLGVSRDEARVQVVVEVRSYPSFEPVIGATVAVGAADGFTPDGSGAWVAGATTTHDAHVLFPNVDPAQPPSVTVTAPGRNCSGVTSLAVAAGELAFTTFACAD